MKRVFTIPERSHGPGPIYYSWQKCGGNFLVTTGYDHLVNIYDRHGEKKDQINMPGTVTGMAWDKEGDLLGLICDKSPVIVIWDSNSKKISQVDTGLRDSLSLLLWSKSAPLVAVGTLKGNLLIYNHRSSRKVPVLGKHSKRIIFGAWSQHNYLALVGEDKVLTVSNQDGDTLCQNTLKAEPSLVQFSAMKQDDRTITENTVSLVLNKKTLFLLNIYDPENPVLLAFQERYGSIVDYKWYGDGLILIGFTCGFFIVISTLLKEIGQELFQIRSQKDVLTHITSASSQNKLASCGDNTIKIYDLTDLQEVQSIITVDDERQLDWMEWTDDGQLLAVSSNEGNLHVYLTKLPVLGDSYDTTIAFLTSLLEITIQNILLKDEPSISLRIEVEPGFLALGPYHIAVGLNNRIWFYGFPEDQDAPFFLKEQEYLGTITSLRLNGDYAAALFEGKIQLHLIEEIETDEKEARLFPDGSFSNVHISCHSMTKDFLIYGTDTGDLHYFYLEDWQMVNNYHHTIGIRNLFSDAAGLRVLFTDEKVEAYIYNPITDEIINVPEFPPKFKGVLWDNWPLDKGVFIVYDEFHIFTYIDSRETIEGNKVEIIGKTRLPSGQFPLLLNNGELTCQTQSGKVTSLVLSSHQFNKNLKESGRAEVKDALQKAAKLRRFNVAWNLCQILDKEEDWLFLASQATYYLDIDFAIKVYREIGNVGMVWDLRSIKDLEDKNLLAGHLAMFRGEFNKAQDLYLASHTPTTALEMRCDLLHWDQALQLATKLAPDRIPFISKEYALQLEFMGDAANALLHYERGITHDPEHEVHDETCKGGIARASIRCNNIQRGFQIAQSMNNRQLKKECAEILENIKQYSESAHMYENANYPDRAAMLYIKLKNWNKVGELLVMCTSPKIHLQYAKAKEADGSFLDAAKAYALAQDYENVIRIYLDHLNNPEAAVAIVKETKSLEGAKMVARFFQKLNDMTTAIQFLVLSQCNEEAFQLAQSTGKMDIYAELIGSDATSKDYLNIAAYYEGQKSYVMAGKFFHLAGQQKQAVYYLLKDGGKSDDGLQLCIDAVSTAKDAGLTKQLIQFLMGDTDGIPKDFKYLFRLYMALKNYRDAGKTAIIIAREEQNAGNYKNAHALLLSMYCELKRHRIKIPSEMSTNLMIIHSYILVKLHVKRGDHLKSARMLVRVANNISKFPAHIVPLLTSTVIECHRSGLKNSAFSYAAMLMRPEYRNLIDPKYKKKIEAIIRKPQKTELEEPCSPCPYCDLMLTETELSCPDCRNTLPYCIITGRHIIKDDLTSCPDCMFPATLSEFLRFIEDGEPCPMCAESIVLDDLDKVEDPQIFLQHEGDE